MEYSTPLPQGQLQGGGGGCGLRAWVVGLERGTEPRGVRVGVGD